MVPSPRTWAWVKPFRRRSRMQQQIAHQSGDRFDYYKDMEKGKVALVSNDCEPFPVGAFERVRGLRSRTLAGKFAARHPIADVGESATVARPMAAHPDVWH